MSPRRERDYQAEYAARRARAQAQGYAGYREQRIARAEHRPLPADPMAQTQQAPVIREGAWVGNVTTSMSPDAILAALRAAAATGDPVAIRATFQRPDGSYRTRYMEGPLSTDLEAQIADGLPGENAGAQPVGPVQVIAGSSSMTGHHGPPGAARTIGGRINPQDILDLIDAYDGDVWAAIADLWGDDYFG